MNVDKNLGRFIDSIRDSRNMRRLDLVDGIVSLRQYKRYVSGEITIPNKVLFKLTDRLSMSIANLFQEFTLSFAKEEKWIMSMYDTYNSESTHVFLNRYKTERKNYNLSQEDSMWLETSKVILESNINRIDKHQVAFELKKIIGYPEILKKTKLNIAELQGFMALVNVQTKLDQDSTMLDEFLSFLKTFQFPKDRISISIHILVTTSYDLAQLGRYEEALKYATDAIKFAKEHFSTIEMFRTYSIIGMCHHDLGNFDEMEKALEVAIIYGNLAESDEYYQLGLKAIKENTGWEPKNEWSYKQ